MVVAEKPLWFGSCVGETVVTLAIVYLLFGASFTFARIVRRWRADDDTWAFTTALTWFLGIGAALMTVASFAWPFPPQIVRLRLFEDSVEIRVCRTQSEHVRTYQLKDVAFDYVREERGTQRVVHHMLEARLRGGENLGAIELVERNRFHLAGLRKLAPAAAEQYERALASGK
jgi:hypothetical protein